MREEKRIGGDVDQSLTKLLEVSDLLGYESDMRRKLKLRNAGDLQYVEEVDLTSIGMSRPEQKRLRKEYARMYPSGIFGKVRKAFKRSESVDRRMNPATASRCDSDEQHVIPTDRIKLCKELGTGEFGSVWQATWLNAGEACSSTQVAVKCVHADKLLSSSSTFLQEAAIMTKMRHEHVVRLYGVVLDTKNIMMVSELASCGSLLECLHKPALRDSFPVHVLCEYAEQIALGMAYLESQRLIHRDLAARNVLVFSAKLVKISDFGLSRSLGVGEDYYRSEFTTSLKLPIAWCAPECINFLKFTNKSDVWAYGVTMWEMFSYGEMPHKGRSGAHILELVDRRKEHLPRPQACPEDIYEMMVETWTHQYQDRPTFADIIDKFPERRAQSVRAIVDCIDAASDHLRFKKDDLITVISRNPASYPDGYYWFGSLRNGKLGLFRPTDTVAHLGSEPPCSNGTLESVVEQNSKKKGKKSKEGEREKKKLLISEPVGEVRHTCHVGIDGTAFGLLQLDKKNVCASSPSTSRGSTSQISPNPSQTSSSTSSSVAMRDSVARHGVPIKETMSLRDIGPLTRDTISGGRASVPAADLSLDRNRSRGSVTPTAPPESAANSLKNPLNGFAARIDDLPDDIREKTPVAAPRGPIAAIYAKGTEIQKIQASAEDEALCDEIEHLNRDLTNYSISSICAKRNDEEEEEEEKSELTKMQQRQQKQQDEWSSAAQEAYRLLVECGTTLKETARASVSPPPRPATPPLEQCQVEENSPKRVHIIQTKLIDGPARGLSPIEDRIPAFTTPMASRKPLPPTPAGDGKPPAPCRPPKTRQFPLVDEKLMGYDNLNGFGAGARSPPPVPPKPKVSFADEQT